MDEFMPPDLAADGYWQNEDMELDTRRKLIIGALDPRHTERRRSAPARRAAACGNPACKSGFYVISYADPANLGRSATSSSCPPATRRAASRTAATSGPAARRARATTRTGSGAILTDRAENGLNRTVGNGRPIWVTDLRNPLKPEVSDQPVDVWRNDKYTDYSHDVDEDDQGIAWVSGRGGIRGYATIGPPPRPVPEPGPQGDAVRPDPRGRRRRGRHVAARDADAQLGPPDGRLGARGRRQEGQRDRGHRGGVPGRATRAAGSCSRT